MIKVDSGVGYLTTGGQVNSRCKESAFNASRFGMSLSSYLFLFNAMSASYSARLRRSLGSYFCFFGGYTELGTLIFEAISLSFIVCFGSSVFVRLSMLFLDWKISGF